MVSKAWNQIKSLDLIHIMHFGPLTDLYGTPGAPKRAHFGPKRPFLGPLRSAESLGGQIWSQLPLIGPTQLVTWHQHTLAWYRPSSGPLGPQKGQFWPQMSLLGTQRSQEGPRGQNLVLTATACSARVKLMVTTHFDLVSALFWAPRGPKRASFGPKCSF